MSNQEKERKQTVLKKVYSYLIDKLSFQITKKLKEQGKLPVSVVAFLWLVFWGGTFFFFTVFLPLELLWIRIFAPLLISLAVVNAMTELGKKMVGFGIEEKEREEESYSVSPVDLVVTSDEKVSIPSHCILKSEEENKVFLLHDNKVVPVYLVSVLTTGKKSGYSFSSLLNYPLKSDLKEIDFSVVDSDKGEFILFLGKELKIKNFSYSLLLRLTEDFYSKVQLLLADIKRENVLEFEIVEDNSLLELFPLYPEVFAYQSKMGDKDEKELKNTSIKNKKKEISQEKEKEENQNSKFDEIGKKSNKIEKETGPFLLKTKLSQEELAKVTEKKELLLSELTYSFDNFLDFAKLFYKKALERQLDEKFDLSNDEFLRLVQLYTEKNDYEFVYPSYFTLQKYESFKIFEIPSSQEIDNFAENLVKECLFTTIDENVKKELKTFLLQKCKNRERRKEEKAIGIKVSSSIPLPSVKNLSET